MNNNYYLNYLDELESESIFILREVFARFKNPVILFSGGKDSIVVTHLAKKAFYPANIPFPLLHVDTGHNFSETIRFRDQFVAENSIEKLITVSVQEAIDRKEIEEEIGENASRNWLQIHCLLDAIRTNKIDCAIGGARRDEEKARAKERFFSHRDHSGQWNPHNQRPELWQLYNTKHNEGENFRAFPINNWTELDIWHYIKRENIQVPSLYFAKERQVVWRSNSWIPNSKFIALDKVEKIETKNVRFRTLGDVTITGAIESNADTLDKIIQEISSQEISERGNRKDDKRSNEAMEERKRQGYF